MSIIFNETWIADGYEATVTEPNGTVHNVPHFSELFSRPIGIFLLKNPIRQPS